MFFNRLLPNGTDNYISEDGVNYYRNLFKSLLENGITPVVTLFHWDMPQVFMDMGGWSNPVLVDYFEDYARVAYSVFGDLVQIWTTMNEPHQHCSEVNYIVLFNTSCYSRLRPSGI